jgi:hypothetical protein
MTVYTIDRMHCTKVGMVGEVERAAINGFRLADSAATSRLAPVLHAWYQLDFADWPDRIVRTPLVGFDQLTSQLDKMCEG